MEKMVTRTITSATVVCVVADLETMQMHDMIFSYPANLTVAPDILKAIQAANETDACKIVTVKMDTIKKGQALYGMTETDFLRYAKRMENRFKMEN